MGKSLPAQATRIVVCGSFLYATQPSSMSHLGERFIGLKTTISLASWRLSSRRYIQRVTRLSEFRFWGGSGNTANFNVPYIFNEAKRLRDLERKARTIQDHLERPRSHIRALRSAHRVGDK